jgi:hypothetical protein
VDAVAATSSSSAGGSLALTGFQASELVVTAVLLLIGGLALLTLTRRKDSARTH